MIWIIVLLVIMVLGMGAMMYLIWNKVSDKSNKPIPATAQPVDKDKIYKKRQTVGFLIDGLLIIVGAGIYWAVDWGIHLSGSGSMGLDPVFIQKIAFSALSLFVGASVAMILFKLRFPNMYKYLLRDGFDDFFQIPIRDRVWIVILILLVFLLCFTIILT